MIINDPIGVDAIGGSKPAIVHPIAFGGQRGQSGEYNSCPPAHCSRPACHRFASPGFYSPPGRDAEKMRPLGSGLNEAGEQCQRQHRE